jgi:uncharacterized membrane protein YfcA
VPDASLVILAGAFVGGLVSGLTGFGTGLVTLPVWLLVIPPLLASPLVVLCSIVGQLQTLPAIWHAIDVRRLAPFVLAGIVGVPLGAWALPHVPAGAFRAGVGVILVVVCGFLLASRTQYRIEGRVRAADAFIGICSGVLGGLAGLSGALLTLWASFRGWGKDERRAVFQGFNTSILVLALAAQAVAGYLTPEVWWLLLAALPGTVTGAWIGRRIYARLNVAAFHRVVLSLLLLAGAAMVVTAA